MYQNVRRLSFDLTPSIDKCDWVALDRVGQLVIVVQGRKDPAVAYFCLVLNKLNWETNRAVHAKTRSFAVSVLPPLLSTSAAQSRPLGFMLIVLLANVFGFW